MEKVRRHKSSKYFFRRFNQFLEAQIQILAMQIIDTQGKALENQIKINGQTALMDLILYILLKKSKSKEDQLLVIQYLKSLDHFMALLDPDSSSLYIEEILTRITKCLTVQEFFNSGVFCRIGERGHHFYIILKGSVSILMPSMIKMQLTVNEYLIHLSFLNQLNEFELMRLTEESNKEIYDVNTADPSKPRIVNLSNKSLKYYQRRNVDCSTAGDYITMITPRTSIMSSNGYYPIISIWIYSVVVKLEEGSTFGESALESKKNVRTATVFINEETVFGVLNELEFKMSIKAIQLQSKNEKIQFILDYNLFGSLSFDLFYKKFWNYFFQIKKKQGDVLFSQNEDRRFIYFIRNGEFDISCRLSFREIYSLLEKFGQRSSPLGRNQFNSYNIQRNMKIATMKRNTLLGTDDLLTKEKRFFCSAVCVSKTADLFAIEVKMFDSIIDFCLSRRKYKEFIAEKNQIMIQRLKAFKFVTNIVYKRTSEQQQMSQSEKSIVDSLEIKTIISKRRTRTNNSKINLNSPLVVTENKLRLRMNNKLPKSPENKIDHPLMSEADSPIIRSQLFQTLKSSYNNKRLRFAKPSILSGFNLVNHKQIFSSDHSNCNEKNNEYKSAKNSFTNTRQNLTTAKPLRTAKNKKNNDTPEERKLFKLCKKVEKVNPYKTLLYSKVVLNSDYSIKKSYDLNTFLSCCLMSNE